MLRRAVLAIVGGIASLGCDGSERSGFRASDGLVFVQQVEDSRETDRVVRRIVGFLLGCPEFQQQ